MDQQVLSVVLAALIAGGITLVTTRWQRPKIDAESESLAVATMTRALETANRRIAALEKDVANLKVEHAKSIEERDYLLEGNDILTGQIREMGGRPRWPK